MSIVDSQMTSQNLVRAQTHVKNVCSLGVDVALIKAGTKDELGGILTESKTMLKSFPTRYTPYDRKIVEKISWAEETEIICYISKLRIDELDTNLSKLQKKYKKMRVMNKTYDIIHIEYYGAFANDFLYVVVGGKS